MKTAIEAYAAGFEAPHIQEVDNPNGIINWAISWQDYPPRLKAANFTMDQLAKLQEVSATDEPGGAIAGWPPRSGITRSP